jgi:SAM-dependent methyltransferase
MPVFMDFPTAEIDTLDAVVAGWVAGDNGELPVRVTAGGREFPHFIIERPDVRAAHHQYPFTTGIGAAIDILQMDNAPFPVTIEFGTERAKRNVKLTPHARAMRDREKKLRDDARQWCERHICCPHCRGSLVHIRDSQNNLACMQCGGSYGQGRAALDFLPANMRFALTPRPETTSSNPYDPAALELINRTVEAGGMVLDCGAGFRAARMRNVINVEIAAYRSTDVLAVGEALPFEDGCFDTVLSLAVLEHVRNPFACAREMLRVLKPGGQIMCQVPFLQPEHSFPGHFYNMTQTGIQNLFAEMAEVVSVDVPPHGHPIFGVQWILREYMAGLPESRRDEFSNMTLGQAATLDPARFLTTSLAYELNAETAKKIACLSTVVFRRPS